MYLSDFSIWSVLFLYMALTRNGDIFVWSFPASAFPLFLFPVVVVVHIELWAELADFAETCSIFVFGKIYGAARVSGTDVGRLVVVLQELETQLVSTVYGK